MPKRSAVEGLPKAVKTWLDHALVEGNFSGYELLADDLKARGYAISKSAIHRYGQDFGERLKMLKLASEQAKAIVESSPDDEGAVSEALMRLVQEKLFQVMLDFKVDPDKPLNIASAAKAVAELSRATVTQKKWQMDIREKIAGKLRDMEAQATEAGENKKEKKPGFDLETLRRVREEIYGIVQ